MRLTTISLAGFFVIAASTAVFAQTTIPWLHNMEQARQLAQRDQRLLLIHFYADWCEPCRTLERTVFPHPDVGRSISANYIPVKLDIDQNQALAEKYGVSRIPADVIADANGRVLFQTQSPSNPAQYTQLLNSLASNQRLTTPVHSVAARMPQQGEPIPGAPQNRWETSTWGQTANREMAAATQAYGPVDSGYDARSAWQGNSYSNETPGFSGPEGQQTPGTERSSYVPPQEQRPPQAASNPQAGWGQSNPYANNQSASSSDPIASSWIPSSSNPSPSPGGPGPLSASANGTAGGFANPYVTNAANAASGSPPGQTSAQAAPTNPPLAMDGHCAVTLAESEKWEKGSRLWGARHRGRTYLFVSQQQQQKFLADPDRYSPVLSGYDPTRFVDYGEPVPGQRRHGVWFRGKIYLFADENSLKRFELNSGYYAQKADEIMMAGGR